MACLDKVEAAHAWHGSCVCKQLPKGGRRLVRQKSLKEALRNDRQGGERVKEDGRHVTRVTGCVWGISEPQQSLVEFAVA